MSISLPKKIYWRNRNRIEYLLMKLLKRGSGMLSHRNDKRDKRYDIGAAQPSDRPKDFSLDTGVRLDQRPFNACIHFARTAGRSTQTRIRLSARWACKVMRKFGWITGDGWSSLRGGNEMDKTYGHIPYEAMPDEINGMSWDEYSGWTKEDDALLETVAPNYRAEQYLRINDRKQAVDALLKNYVLFTACKWYEGKNTPSAPLYKLLAIGGYIGGHAQYITGGRDWFDDWENPQTFSPSYGDKGKVWVDDLFGADQFAIYVSEHLPPESYVHYVMNFCKKPIRGTDAPIYILEEGKRRAFASWERYQQYCAEQGIDTASFYSIPDDALALIEEGDIIS